MSDDLIANSPGKPMFWSKARFKVLEYEEEEINFPDTTLANSSPGYIEKDILQAMKSCEITRNSSVYIMMYSNYWSFGESLYIPHQVPWKFETLNA